MTSKSRYVEATLQYLNKNKKVVDEEQQDTYDVVNPATGSSRSVTKKDMEGFRFRDASGQDHTADAVFGDKPPGPATIVKTGDSVVIGPNGVRSASDLPKDSMLRGSDGEYRTPDSLLGKDTPAKASSTGDDEGEHHYINLPSKGIVKASGRAPEGTQTKTVSVVNPGGAETKATYSGPEDIEKITAGQKPNQFASKGYKAGQKGGLSHMVNLPKAGLVKASGAAPRDSSLPSAPSPTARKYDTPTYPINPDTGKENQPEEPDTFETGKVPVLNPARSRRPKKSWGYMEEEVDLVQNVERGVISLDKNPVKENVNNLLTNALALSFVTPYVGLQKVGKVLANFHIHLPKVPFLEGTHGVQVFDLNQFGEMMGMKDNGEVVTKVETPYHVYFEYLMNDMGRYDIFCEIVDDEELDDLMSEVEDDMEEDEVEKARDERLDESSESVDLAGPETGVRPISGAPNMGACVMSAYIKKKEQKLNEAKGLTKVELSAIRGAAKMKRKMENPRAKISSEKIKPQDRKTKSEVKKKAIESYKSMAANMGNYDAQWRESERNNSAHASKDNIEKFMRLAKQEFDAAKKAKPDMNEYRKKYFKHQERLKTLEGMMRRANKKIEEETYTQKLDSPNSEPTQPLKDDPFSGVKPMARGETLPDTADNIRSNRPIPGSTSSSPYQETKGYRTFDDAPTSVKPSTLPYRTSDDTPTPVRPSTLPYRTPGPMTSDMRPNTQALSSISSGQREIRRPSPSPSLQNINTRSMITNIRNRLPPR